MSGRPQAAGSATEIREDLEHQRADRDKLAAVLGEFREGWGINPPDSPGEPWTTTPRRNGLPIITGGTLEELGVNLKAAAAAAGLADMLAIEAEFAGWRVWRSSEGAWWATRQARQTQEMQDCGLHGTVGDASKPHQLRVMLTEQAKLQEWAAAHEWQIPGEQARRKLGLPPEDSQFRSVGRPADTGADPPQRM